MDPKAQFVFFLLALVCFVVSAFWGSYVRGSEGKGGTLSANVNVLALGLAFFDFVFMWNAYKAM